jgi:thioredoxin-dependent peroxiredoxin
MTQHNQLEPADMTPEIDAKSQADLDSGVAAKNARKSASSTDAFIYPNQLSMISGVYQTTMDEAFSFAELAKQMAAQSKSLILYFYPKDNTPGCTAQSIDLRNHFEALSAKNVVVIGVSRDSMASHHRFAQKLGLPFALLSDPEELLCAQFDVVKAKNMYGKKVRGIQRSTFIYNANGELAAAWPNVKANQHIEDVLAFFKIVP